MFSRPWFTLLRRQVLIHRRVVAFVLTVAAVLLGWAAFVARPAVVLTAAAAAPTAVAPALSPGFVRLPVRFADGEMAALLHPGQRIQVWATNAATQRSEMIAGDAQVMEVPTPPANSASTVRQSRLVVVGVRGTEVEKMTNFNANGVLSYVIAQ